VSKIICRWKNEVCCHSLYAGVQTIWHEGPSGKCELTDVELEAVRGAHNSGFAPVSPTCLQSILLGNGNCGTQGLGQDRFSATTYTNFGRSQ
jgi:hypothetical protein